MTTPSEVVSNQLNANNAPVATGSLLPTQENEFKTNLEIASTELTEYTEGEFYYLDYKVKLDYKAKKEEVANAQYKVGYAYYFGLGVEKDYKKAVEWLKKATINGHTDAKLALANAYLLGKGTDKDGLVAFEWYKSAANKGSLFAQCRIIFLLENQIAGLVCDWDAERVIEQRWLPKVLTNIHLLDSKLLAKSLCQDDLLERKEDEQSNLSLIEKYSNSNIPARFVLAKMLSTGVEVKQDIDRAITLLEPLARRRLECCSFVANFMLAELYTLHKRNQKELDKAKALVEELRRFDRSLVTDYLNEFVKHGNTYAKTVLEQFSVSNRAGVYDRRDERSDDRTSSGFFSSLTSRFSSNRNDSNNGSNADHNRWSVNNLWNSFNRDKATQVPTQPLSTQSLGTQYGAQNLGTQNLDTQNRSTFQRLNRWAEEGDKDAQYKVALMLIDGSGTDRNVDMGLYFLGLVADDLYKPNAIAQYLLWKAYDKGEIRGQAVKRDPSDAGRYLTKVKNHYQMILLQDSATYGNDIAKQAIKELSSINLQMELAKLQEQEKAIKAQKLQTTNSTAVAVNSSLVSDKPVLDKSVPDTSIANKVESKVEVVTLPESAPAASMTTSEPQPPISSLPQFDAHRSNPVGGELRSSTVVDETPNLTDILDKFEKEREKDKNSAFNSSV